MTQEQVFVESALAGKCICARCNCTLATFADDCAADLLDLCPGYLAIEDAKKTFRTRKAR